MVERLQMEGQPRSDIRLEEVPHIRQRPYWCNYASLAMVLGYYKYPVGQDDVFSYFHGPYDPKKEENDPSLAPDFHGLAAAAKDIIAQTGTEDNSLRPLQARLFTGVHFRQVQERRRQMGKDLKPQDIIYGFLLKGIPPIIRYPKHTVVITGIKFSAEQYMVHDPISGSGYMDRHINVVNKLWASGEDNPHATRGDYNSIHRSYQMLLIS